MTDPAIIEAAARAVSAAYLKEITWEDQEEIGRTFYRNLAKVVLAAVTPLIEAAALERADIITDAMIDAAIHSTPSPYEIDMADREAFATMVREILKAQRANPTVEWEAKIFDPQGPLKPLRDWKPED
jgi:hypothetical protein